MATMAPTNFAVPTLPGMPISGGGSSSSSALSSLIKSLGYVVPANKEMQKERAGEVDTNQALRDQYTKDAAFADAQGAMNAMLQQALAELLPGLTRAADGAGASASSLRALMTQQAGAEAAQRAAQLGLDAATNYGNISGNYSGIIEALTRPDTQSLGVLAELLARRNATQGSSSSTSRPKKQYTRINEGQVGVGKKPTSTFTGIVGGSGGSSGNSSAAFFNRPGGILAESQGGSYYAGPTISADQYLTNLTQAGAMSPVYQNEGVFNAAAQLYNNFVGR